LATIHKKNTKGVRVVIVTVCTIRWKMKKRE
jgi:hypothetical protein